jgi:hypothetical protein
MTADMFANHISDEELIDYVAEDHLLSEAREEAIEIHLASCDDCAAAARQLRAMSMVFDHWTLKTYAEVHQPPVPAAIQDVVPGLNAQRRRWLRGWLETTSGRAAAAARLMLDAASQTADLVTESLGAITLVASPWQLSVVGAHGRGVERGQTTDTESEPLQSASPNVPQVTLQVGHAQPGGPRPILVRVDGLTPEQLQAKPLVLLLPAPGSGAQPLGKVLQASSSLGGATALFREVPPGEYLAVFEPSGEGESEGGGNA